MSLLDQDTAMKWQVDKNDATNLDGGKDSGEYKIKAIYDSTVYTRESKLGHLLGLNYLVSWKNYLEEKNT